MSAERGTPSAERPNGTDPVRGVPLRAPHSALRAFLVLVVQSFQRHWRVRQMGWAAVGLLGVATFVVATVTASKRSWGLPDRRIPRTNVTYREYARDLSADHRYFERQYDRPLPPRPVSPAEVPNPLDPTADGLQTLILSVPSAILTSEKLLRDVAVMNFSRWVVVWVFLGFVLPLFTLAYATAAFGSDREDRTLVWLMTRPIPRSGVYLAKFVGTLPWVLVFSGGGFAALCLAGGWPGREALRLYWPAAVGGSLAFAALFHLIGAVFRRPVVVGVVYVFFFEVLVAALPGSLKLFSVTFYARSLMYNAAVRADYPAAMLDVAEPVSPATAWAVLAGVTVGLTALGMWLFARSEYRDDI